MGLGQGLLEVKTAKLELVKDGVLKTWAGTVHRGEAVLKSGASCTVILVISNRKSASRSCVEHAPWQEDFLIVLSLLFHQPVQFCSQSFSGHGKQCSVAQSRPGTHPFLSIFSLILCFPLELSA